MEVAYVSFIYVTLFFVVSTAHTTDSKDEPFFLKYSFIVWAMYIFCLLPAILVLIKKTRKMSARWCILITAAFHLRTVFDSSASAPIGEYLFFCIIYLPCAILLMMEGNLLPGQPEMNSAAAQF
ncbi:MAG: hypothetical protein FGM61_08555 [Sediminibacterium sp.]|nr:hypothetical protein [Sediminibacterium sp.]